MVRTAAERTIGAAGGFEQVRVQQAVSRTQEPSGLVSTLRYVVEEGSGLLTARPAMWRADPPTCEGFLDVRR
ncbi:hypothetical protein [Streptomyces sp. NPDC050564]|uniref:hypothetical protein n=1 Tax=Streptomyces sp. NPDC050564 TaxID=3365631 RepID=UPI0037B3364C